MIILFVILFGRKLEIRTENGCIHMVLLCIAVIFIKSNNKQGLFAKSRLLETSIKELFEPLGAIGQWLVMGIIVDLYRQ